MKIHVQQIPPEGLHLEGVEDAEILDLHEKNVVPLGPLNYPLKVEDFAMQIDLEGRETIDLTPYIREDILLNLPPYPHCDWNGEKVCKGVQRKNLARPAEPFLTETNAWEELDKLKVKSRK